jgi:small subunit ribosomal protein S16
LSVVIRLSRQGHRHRPFYRIAVADQRKAATGKFLQHIGYYDPAQNPPTLKVDEVSALKWMNVGAQPSDTVRSLFQHTGIMDKFAKVRQGKATAETAGKVVAWKSKKPKIHKVKKEEMAKTAAAEAAAATAATAAAAAAVVAEKAAAEKAAADAAAAAAAEAPAA